MRPLAVIDIETTDLNPYRHDRLIEVAAVLVMIGRGSTAEFTTLVNPERDIGPTRIHGITASDVLHAPRFAEIAGHLTDFLAGSAALVGHNVRFDLAFLAAEYTRLGVAMPGYATLDTMSLVGRGTLATCCARMGSTLESNIRMMIRMNQIEMSGPSVPTVKRLFAVSGDQCAFPKCKTPLVDPASGKVTGRICHIKGRKPGSPRHDPKQTDAERHSFDNLVLMCPIHHDVIDADEASYTVERLRTIKAEHESNNKTESELGDDVAKQFITSIRDNLIIDGSIILTQHQMGGQVAHRITNVGPQPRQLSVAAAKALVSGLRKLPPEQVSITALLGDPESIQLAMTLNQVLAEAGWRTESGINQSVYSGLPRGVILRVSSERPTVVTLGNWLLSSGLKAEGELVVGLTRIEIVVGANL